MHNLVSKNLDKWLKAVELVGVFDESVTVNVGTDNEHEVSAVQIGYATLVVESPDLAEALANIEGIIEYAFELEKQIEDVTDELSDRDRRIEELENDLNDALNYV